MGRLEGLPQLGVPIGAGRQIADELPREFRGQSSERTIRLREDVPFRQPVPGLLIDAAGAPQNLGDLVEEDSGRTYSSRLGLEPCFWMCPSEGFVQVVELVVPDRQTL